MGKQLKIEVVATADGPQPDNTLPFYRIKGNQRRLMGWVKRAPNLIGVVEIRAMSDGDAMYTEVVRRSGDA
jgi:hypothetical protein